MIKQPVMMVCYSFEVFFGREINIFYLGWATLKIVLFALLGVVIVCAAGLIAFFVIRFV
jgi:hypothetical protein